MTRGKKGKGGKHRKKSAVVGTRYALGITFSDDASALLASLSNPCAEGMVFGQGRLDDPWSQLPNGDKHFATVVTA